MNLLPGSTVNLISGISDCFDNGKRQEVALFKVLKKDITDVGYSKIMDIGKFKNLLFSKSSKQASMLYLSLLLSLFLGIITSVVNTRLLGASDFGEYKLIQTTWALCLTSVTFGLFITTGNMLANGKTKNDRILIAHGVVVTCIISIFFILVLFLASFVIDGMFEVSFGSRLRLFLLLVIALPFSALLKETLRATNSIYLLSFLNAFPQLLYLLMMLLIHKFVAVNVEIVLFLFLLSVLFTVLIIIGYLKPKWINLRSGVKEIVRKNQDIGIHIYIALVVGAISVHSSQYIIAYTLDTRTLALFVLALTLTMPLTLIPNVIATTLFKKFVSADSIPPIAIGGAVAISIVSLLGFLLLIDYIVPILYKAEFAAVTFLAKICAVAAVIHGTADLFNRFLLAKSDTRKLRRNGIQLSILGLASYSLLINQYGIVGAPITNLIVAIVYLITMLRYYLSSDYSKKKV